MRSKHFESKMGRMKKVLSLSFALLLLLSVTACSQSALPNPLKEIAALSNSSNVESVKQEASTLDSETGSVYQMEQLPLPDAEVNLLGAQASGDKIYLCGVDSTQRQHFYVYDPGANTFEPLNIGADFEYFQLCSGWDESLRILTIDESGGFVLHTYASAEEQSSLAFPVDGDIIETVTALKNGYVVQTIDELVITDLSGNAVNTVGVYERTAACIPLKSGGFIAARSVKTPAEMTVIEVYDENFKRLSSYQSKSLYTAFYGDGGQENAVLARTANTVFRLDIYNDAREALVDCYSSGIYGSGLLSLPNGGFLAISGGKPVLLNRPVDGAGTKMLTLAAYNLSFTLDDIIRCYNDSSGEYKIRVIDYAIYDQTPEDNTGLTRLQTDIIAGFTPDIYDLSNLPAELYASKGIFEDLRPYLEQSMGELSERLVPNVYESLLFEDKLYYVLPSFSVMTIFGDASFVGNDEHWGIQDFFSAVDGMEPMEVFGPGKTRQTFLSYMLMFNKDEFVDVKNGKCNFDSDVLRRFLEIAAKLPEEIKPVSSEDFSRTSVGEQKLVVSWFGSRGLNLIAYADAVCSGEAQFVGFPSDKSSGSAIVPTALVGVSSASKNKEAAVDFVRYILSEGQQDNDTTAELPVLTVSLEKRLSAWRDMYASSLSEGRIRLNTIYDGQPYKIEGYSSPERVEACLRGMISHADTLAVFDDVLYQIVLRECTPFFNGRISVQQAAANIQSKATIYLAEQFN